MFAADIFAGLDVHKSTVAVAVAEGMRLRTKQSFMAWPTGGNYKADRFLREIVRPGIGGVGWEADGDNACPNDPVGSLAVVQQFRTKYRRTPTSRSGPIGFPTGCQRQRLWFQKRRNRQSTIIHRETFNMLLDQDAFLAVKKNAPLVSIDLIISASQ